MNRYLKIVLYFLCLNFVISCSQSIETSNSENSGANTMEPYSKALLRIELENTAARTVFPQHLTLEDFDTFILTGVYNAVTTTLGEWSDYTKLQSSVIELDSGRWNFTLEARKGECIYISKTTEQINIGENNISFSLVLYDIGAGSGNLSFTLFYGNAENCAAVKLANAILQKIDGTGLDDCVTELIPENNIISYAKDSIPAGNYRIIITLYADREKNVKLIDYSEIILIASGLETTAEREVESLNEVYHITYNLNDDEEAPAFLNEAQEIYSRYSAFDLPIPIRAGYNFAGWWTNNDFDEEIEHIDCTQDTEVYALWVTGIPVKSNNVNDIISNLKESCELDVVGSVSNEMLRSIRTALNNLENDILVDINLSYAKNIMNIDNGIFYSCNKLKSILLPRFITNIGNTAFESCENLESIIFPEALTSIGIDVFRGCKSLTSIIIPDNVTTIAQGAFQECSNLKKVELPDGLSKLGIMAFMDCENLKEINIPKGIANIGIDTFLRCVNLESIFIPKNVEKIDYRAFYGCKNLSEIELSEGLEIIGQAAFGQCTNLEIIKIPKTVTYIGQMAFTSCERLSIIEISDCSLGYDPFISTNITTVNYLGTLSEWCNSGLTKYFAYKTVYINNELIPNLLIIPDDVEKINDYAFYNCSEIETVIISDSVKSIGTYAFANCINLKSIIIPDNIESIGINAFANCTSLESAEIGNGITEISDYCFDGCSSLERISFGLNIQTLGRRSFANCTRLCEITIPNSVTYIRCGLFYKCENLKTVTFDYSGLWNYNDIGGKFEIIGQKYLTCDNLKDDYTYWFK